MEQEVAGMGGRRTLRRGRDRTLLGRLGIRGKLNLLLLLPLAAVLLVATPFVIVQANAAASAGSTADSARNARELGGLVWELQRERLLTVGYLASPRGDSSAMERQQAKVDETVNQVRSSLGDDITDEMSSALVRLGSLRELRESALRRGISTDSVARVYHALVDAVIGALRLVPQVTSDAEGTRQLTALEALLRANEYGESRGMALIAAAVNRTTGQVLLDDATAQSQLFTERFVQQADVEHAALVVQVDEGDAARGVDVLEAKLPDLRNAGAVETFAGEALSAVGAQSGLRRTVQDRVTSQITDAAQSRADSAQTVAWLVGGGAAALILLVALLSVVVSRSIASPLRKLTDAARGVAELAESELVRVSDTEDAEQQKPRLTAIEVNSSDEVGQLAVAFNRVQSTAAMLVERQAITRHNVSVMFANVAQRTQNLVGRQLALVDELERNEQDERLLASLYRLDHLSTRLRRTADNLLVVAGSRRESNIGAPTELSIALRSALAEIEDYQRVRLGDVHELTVSSALAGDLVLVFAELLENATSFSPPDSFVEVGTTFTADGACLVSIVDHGIGMKPPRLAEENRRLVDRERLDVAPTSVLGLFVVGRLARRHGLAVELMPTQGTGVTARVAIPPMLFNRPMPVAPPPPPPTPPQPMAIAAAAAPAGQAARLPVPDLPSMHIPSAQHTAGFSWFPTDMPAEPALQPVGAWPAAQPAAAQPVAAQPVAAARPAAPAAPVASAAPKAPAPQPAAAPAASMSGDASDGRSGLKRRVAGAQLPGGAAIPPPPPIVAAPSAARPPAPPMRQPQHDPAATRAAMDGFQTAFAKAAVVPASSTPAEQPAAPPSRDGLSRRVPGANLAPGLRTTKLPKPSEPMARTAAKWRERDPEAEKASFDAFASGLERAFGPGDAADQDPMKESTA
jgi:signal transduction histidine kinase